MSGGLQHLIVSGPVLLAIPVAAAAGAVTFLSPCCLPLVPGYLSYLTGMSGAAANDRRRQAATSPAAAQAATMAAGGSLALAPTAAGIAAPAATATQAGATASAGAPAATGNSVADASTGSASTGSASAGPLAGARGPARGRIMLGALLFVLGFSVLYAVEGVAVAGVGVTLTVHRAGLAQILGGLIILLGLLFIGLFDRFSFAGRIVKPGFRPRAGLAGAPLLGVLFGLGWTPCTGPTLGAVLTLGFTSGTALRGGLLAFVYALGIGIPFLIVAFAFQRGVNVFGFARRHARLITRIGGMLLIAVGVLEVTGAWAAAITWLQVHWLNSYTAPI
ncbi:MAG TPA: cytochrome c biogenesis CcdA family protein [Streptosporangiaceae bacterium]|nr:cytochrome c biogenesis CcdA family protein [Streptosporangiaceae bacterium]